MTESEPSAAREFAFVAPAVVVALAASAAALRARVPASPAARALLALLVAGLAVGTATHLENLTRAGFVPRPDLPLACNVFWSSLVVVDPIVAAVLLLRPRPGVVLVLGLMVVDLAVNLTTLGVISPIRAQMAYTLVALISLPVVRAATASPGAR
jgi:hypothetical protein